MPLLRFANPVSDIQKFWDTYRLLFRDLKGERNFGYDEMTEVMIKYRLATSSGATGEEAKRRSFRDDRTRDPLYNQLKMYSELYRMLGWLHPDKDRTHFVMSELGGYVASETDWNRAKPLVKECVLNIVFPNPHYENRGGQRLRPFPFLLKLINGCDNVIFRDELIITVLCLENDRATSSLDRMIGKIRSTRGDYQRLFAELQNNAKPISINTAKNYTRFPLGVIRSFEWAEDISNKNIYSKSLTCYRMTHKGIEEIEKLQKIVDIRMEDLTSFSSNALYNFILLSNYSLLERAGYPLQNVLNDIPKMETECRDIFEKFCITDRSQIMFSPYQQVESDVLRRVNQYELSTYIEDKN